MRRHLFAWSIGMFGGLFAIGCALTTNASGCGQGAPRPAQVLAGKQERPPVRTAKMPLRPKRVNTSGEEVVVLSEGAKCGCAPGQPSSTAPAETSPPIEHAPKSPGLPPVRLPFDTSKKTEFSESFGAAGLPPIHDQSGNTIDPLPTVRSGMTIPGSPDVPIVDRLPSEGRGSPVPNAEGIVELTNTSVRLGAADDYKSLTGHVASFRKTWRLRYASLENDDTHGGSVMLQGTNLDRLRDGQLVRVRGSVVAPSDRNQPAVFQVQSVEVLAPGN